MMINQIPNTKMIQTPLLYPETYKTQMPSFNRIKVSHHNYITVFFRQGFKEILQKYYEKFSG